MKYAHYLFFVTSLFLCETSFAQGIVIDLSKIKYTSEIEKKAFEKWEREKKIDEVELLLCLDTAITSDKVKFVKQKIDNFIDSKISDWKERSNEKSIKKIFNIVHETFFQKYEETARFDRLFETGEYNCLTASALFAIIFKRLQIPFQIRTTSTHAYVVAYPGAEQIVVEATDPRNGVMQYNDEYKKGFVNMLEKEKLISAVESRNKTIDELFTQYFYKSDTVEMQELIGEHYSNDAIFASRENLKEYSLAQMLKAYALNQDKDKKYMLIICLALEIDKKFELSDSTQLYYYTLYQKLSLEKNSEYLISKYYYLAHDMVFGSDNLKEYERIGNQLILMTDDSIEKNKIKEHLYLTKGSYYGLKKDIKKLIENHLEVWVINPKNVQAEAVLNQSLDYIQKNIYYSDSLIDSIQVLFEKAIERTNSKRIASALCYSLFYQAGHAYEYTQYDVGQKKLKEAEMYLAKGDTSNINHDAIANAYMAMYRHYGRIKDNAARGVLLRGIAIDPANEKLKEELIKFDSRGYTPESNSNYWSTHSNKYPPPPPPPTIRYQQTVPSKPRTLVIKSGK